MSAHSVKEKRSAIMRFAFPRRLLHDTTFVAKRAAAGLLSHSAGATRKRSELGLRAVEQLKWLQQTQRPLSGRLGRVTIQQLEENIINLHASLDFSSLLSAAEILSQKRPLRHESVLLQIFLYHVLQRPAEEALARSRSINEENSALHIAATPAEKTNSVLPPDTATAPLTDEQLLQLLLCWDRAAALRPSVEILARPLLRTLVGRTSRRSQRPQENPVQRNETPACVLPREKVAADSRIPSKQTCCFSNQKSKAGVALSGVAHANEQRCDFFTAKAPSSGQRNLVWCWKEGAEESKSEEVASSHLREKIKLLVFLGRRLDELLVLEQEQAAAACLEVTPLREEQQQGAYSRLASATGTVRTSANASETFRSKAVYDRGEGVTHWSRSTDEGRDLKVPVSRIQEEVTAFKQEILWKPAPQSSAGAEVQEAPTGVAAPVYSRIACATWHLLLHCYDIWRRFNKRFGWKEDQAAAVLPDLALSGARVLLALLHHLQAVESKLHHLGGREEGAGITFSSEVTQQQPQLSHIRGHVVGREYPLLQLSSLPASPTDSEGRTLGGREDVKRFAERKGLEEQSEWTGCSTATDVQSVKDRQEGFCQVHDLQQQAAKLQRQMLQLRLQCLSHSQALVQIPAAAYLLRSLHEASSQGRSQQCDQCQGQQRGVRESSKQQQRLQLAEADVGRQQPYKQEGEDLMEAEQVGWRRLSFSLDRHVRKERIRRSTATLRLEDVCNCFNAVLRCRWVPIGAIEWWLRAACNQTDNLSPEYRADLEAALAHLSTIMRESHRFIHNSASLAVNSLARVGTSPTYRNKEGVGGTSCVQSSGQATQTCESGKPGNRARTTSNLDRFWPGRRLQKSETCVGLMRSCHALTRSDGDNSFHGVEMGWIIPNEAADDTKEQVVHFPKDHKKGLTTHGKMIIQGSQLPEMSTLLDLINRVKSRKILQRSHRSGISWNCGRRDEKAGTF